MLHLNRNTALIVLFLIVFSCISSRE
jgi:hypothetical protein